ncbi:Amino-acid permease BAT1 [Tolypocladium capitatum]|uniref:Amino-acid permease BAT1 n=1 Tax=Tolypocladium capitatum TaxID=45235 RepID=A0A2K3QB04_9HYPO|nr:Amino-acid permease BAT1 [Tolypocladium capitatum]
MEDQDPHASAGEAADRALASLGYRSELPRNLSMMSILGMSFAIMAVPFGISTTMYITLTNGQSVTVLYGWILVSVISVCLAASLAEICAVFPTAGGVYYWSAMLSTRRWAPLVSFIDGWLTLVGNWTVTLSINFSGAQLILSAITIFDDGFVANQWQTVLCFWAVMLVCALVNAFGSRHLDFINKVCIYWTATSVLVIMVTLLAMAPARRSGAFVFAHYDASASGWPAGWSFFVGLLQRKSSLHPADPSPVRGADRSFPFSLAAAYTLTGYGMVASMCEEVQNPEREVPRAIVLSVVAAGITGVIFIIPLLFVLPDVQMLLQVANSQPIGLLFKTVTGSASGGFGLLFLILGILMFAGVGALTAASRCTYAFARDGAIPGHRLWGQVNKKLDMPLWALALSTVVNCLLGCIYFGSSAAFNSFTGVATICLSTSYGVPVLVNLVRRRDAVKASPFPLGKFGPLINIICIGWIVFSVVIFCMPVSLPVDASSMNYASAVFAGFAAIAFIWYFAYARKNFTGPPVIKDDAFDPGVMGRGSMSGPTTSGATDSETQVPVLEKQSS